MQTTFNLTNRRDLPKGWTVGASGRYLLDLLTLPEDISEAVVSSPNRPSDGQVTEKNTPVS